MLNPGIDTLLDISLKPLPKILRCKIVRKRGGDDCLSNLEHSGPP